MVVGTEVAITVAVSLFLFILGIGVRMLWNISNTLTKSNMKLDNISNNISSMSNTLSRTNELLIRQNERLGNNINRSDGGFKSESPIQRKLSDYDFGIDSIDFDEVSLDTSGEAGKGSETAVISLRSYDKRPTHERDILKGVLKGKAKEFFDGYDARNIQVSTTTTDNGFYYTILIPTRDEEIIQEFLDVLQEEELVGSIETRSLF